MFPATTHASKDTPKEERRRVPSYDKSIQGHPRRKEGEERKERKKERGRESERREKRKAGVPSYEQSSRDTPKKGVILSIPFRKTTKSKERKGEGRGRGGLSSRQVPMNLEQALVAATTYGLPEGCHHVQA